MMLIRVGILGNESGWRTLLAQEGIPHAPVSPEDPPEGFSAIVASGVLEPSSILILRGLLAGGSAVLCSPEVYEQISGSRAAKEFVRYVYEDSESNIFEPELVDLFADCKVPSHSNALRSDGGALCAIVGDFGGGHLIVFPFNPAQLVFDRRAAFKSFYAGNRRLPFERVSLVAKGGLRRLVSCALRILHHRRGLPYVHQWYYPAGQQSVFALRIDTDYAGRSEIEQLRDLGRRLDVPLTWFVHVESQKDFLDLFRGMREDEVGVHCFRHRKFRDPVSGAADVRRALVDFERTGLEARSYAAPYGFWDEPLAEAIEQFNFLYTSEFSYDYDSLPSYPRLGSRFSSTLQIPVHPISIGSLRRQGFREDDMTAYFRFLIERKLQGREPIVLYHHPKNRCASVLEWIVQLVRERGIQPTRMIDYASWWKGRRTEDWKITIDGPSIRIETPPAGDDRWMHVVRPDGMEAFFPALPHLPLDRLEWRTPPGPTALPRDIVRIRKFNPWIPVIRAQDWAMSMITPAS